MDIRSLNQAQQMAMIRMSTAQRINSAADDAAGLGISENMQSQASGDQVAQRNMQDSQSMLSTADGALNASSSVLQRMRQLAVQANNGTLSKSDRSIIQDEYSQLKDSLNQIGSQSQFNSKNLLDGTLTNMATTTDANGSTIQVSLKSALSSHLGDAKSGKTLDSINLESNPKDALKIIDGAISQVSDSRSTIGASQNRLDYAIGGSQSSQLSIQSAESRIRDTDMAQQSSELKRINLLQQTYYAAQRMQQNMAGQLLNIIA